MSPSTISASEFKAKCLRILEDVAAHGQTLVITKHGRPVARLLPVQPPRRPLRGTWKGSVRVHGDIVQFTAADDWEAAQ